MTDLTTKQTDTGLVIPKEFAGFTSEETLGGMAPIQEGYLKSFRYFLNRPSTRTKFQIVDNQTNATVWEGDEIKGATIFYGHEIMRLKKGHVQNPGKNEADFTDEENEIVAVTYDKARSKGNFEANGYGKYLTNQFKDLHGKMTRLYLVMLIPGGKENTYGTGTELVAASFSVTTCKSFNALRKTAQSFNLPLPLMRARIFFSAAKSEGGQEYDRVDFEFLKDAKGTPVFSYKSPEAYRTSEFGVSMLNAIIDTHKAAVANAESGDFGGFVEKETVAYDVEADIKSTFKGEEVADPLGDEAPF